MEIKIPTINELLESLKLHDKCRDLSATAKWYEDFSSPTLAEYCRYAHRSVCDLIDEIRAKCETLPEILSLVKELLYTSWNEYKFYQGEHFEHFAELAMVKNKVLDSIAFKIEKMISSDSNAEP